MILSKENSKLSYRRFFEYRAIREAVEDDVRLSCSPTRVKTCQESWSIVTYVYIYTLNK